MSWKNFKSKAPELAKSGERLLKGDGKIAIGFLSSCSNNRPHVAPVCPIFCEANIYLCAVEKSPKTRDLRIGGNYTLHAFLGENDEEFQISGNAHEVTGDEERESVHSSIPFGSFDKSDPIFCLNVERVLWVYWERVGQPDTKAIRKRWYNSEVI